METERERGRRGGEGEGERVIERSKQTKRDREGERVREWEDRGGEG